MMLIVIGFCLGFIYFCYYFFDVFVEYEILKIMMYIFMLLVILGIGLMLYIVYLDLFKDKGKWWKNGK